MAAFTSACSASTCDFDAAGSFDPDGTIATYLWQFGDGTSSSGPTAHHVYATGDPHNVTLTVTDGGADRNRREPVREPISHRSPRFTVTCSGPTCTFDGSGSSDPDGTIDSYVWYFGDGAVMGAGATVTHVYPTGTFSASLIVADNVGVVGGTAPQTLSVVNAPPVASFTVACNGPTCTFDGSGSSDPDGTIERYQWYFGDGGYHLGATATHTFATGTYTVTLLVTSTDSSTATQSQTVSVVNAPTVATFTATCIGLTCAFDGSGSSDPDGTIYMYEWLFGDGGYARGATASHTFAAGTYTVKLIVTADVNTTSQNQTELEAAGGQGVTAAPPRSRSRCGSRSRP